MNYVPICLPNLDECEAAVRMDEAGRLEWFIYEYQPRAEHAGVWREKLASAIDGREQSIAAELRIALVELDVLSVEDGASPKLVAAIARNTAAGIRERLLADGVFGFK